MLDRRLIFAAVFARGLAVKMGATLLGLYLAALHFDKAGAGIIVSAGLAGIAAASLLVTILGDRLGRRASLVALALLSAAGAAAVALGSDPAVLGIAAFLGMLNGMGRDRGAFLIFEQAMLPTTAPDAERTKTFAWYNALLDVGHALGGLLAALPGALQRFAHLGELPSFRASIGVYGGFMLILGIIYIGLSRAVEAPQARKTLSVSPETRPILWKISSLFFIDGLGGGFLTTALLTYYFVERFRVSGPWVGALFAAAAGLNAISHFGAAWLAKRIGLINTMVFTHIPSSLLLIGVAFSPAFWIAAIFFLLREALVEMDVPTRQSYVMAVVRPEERTTASGVTTLVRMGAWMTGPSIAGFLMKGLAQSAPLFAGAGLKIGYDILLYIAFRKLKPPEETPPR